MTANDESTTYATINNKNLWLTASVYLLGLFMGAIDTGIVTPARTIIQNNLQVDDKTGIWMITIYTLAYAASIPVMGKLADKYGRKYVYLIAILLFGAGSLFCGLSQQYESFTLLLIARVIQAIGGGGIVPIATAEFGTTFPPEKRGMALGLVGGVYGIANVFGASAGSAILDIFGKNNWQYIFYVNIPITLFIVLAGLKVLKNNKTEDVRKIDKLGILLIVSMILSLLYGLKNIDFFNLIESMGSISVYPYILIFAALLPIFVFAEKRAEDPVMNLSYFTNSQIVITFIISLITGVLLMGTIFVPQFSENAVKISTGSGGYFVIVLGLFAGVGAPLSGKLIDKYGAKKVLLLGFGISLLASAFLILVTINYPNLLTVLTGLLLIGLGMGFTIGAPLNYMMLENTKKEEANSALAALSLIRSIGTTIAPAILIGFLAHAGGTLQDRELAILPKEISAPQLPYAEELTVKIDSLKSNEAMKDKLASITFPDFNSAMKIEVNMADGGSSKLPKELIELLKTADVTNITERIKMIATTMYQENTKTVVADIQSGVQQGIDGIQSGIPEMDKSISDLEEAVAGVTKGIGGLEKAVAGMDQGLAGMKKTVASQEKALIQLNGLAANLPPNADAKAKEGLNAKINGLETAISSLNLQIADLTKQRNAALIKLEETSNKRLEMLKGIESIRLAKADVQDTVKKMTVLKNAVPAAFEEANQNYLAEIDKLAPKIESEFQGTLNVGFKQIYMATGLSALMGMILLGFYRK